LDPSFRSSLRTPSTLFLFSSIRSQQTKTKQKQKNGISNIMDPLPGDTPIPTLEWTQVGIGLTFVAFSSIVSQAFHLRTGPPLVIAALRCIVQLTMMATVLQQVFTTKNSLGVAGIAGTFLRSPVRAAYRYYVGWRCPDP
jgi:hypothetical protein